MSDFDALARLAAVIESRKPAQGGDPEKSYIARLLHANSEAVLKKIGEEASEVIIAAKDCEQSGNTQHLVNEIADLWFHTLIALAYYGKTPVDVIHELTRREGLSGLEEKALRKASSN